MKDEEDKLMSVLHFQFVNGRLDLEKCAGRNQEYFFKTTWLLKLFAKTYKTYKNAST
jgi:hypothetical protein